MRCSFLIVWVDFSFGGEKGESNKSGYDEVVVLDGWLGVFGFEWALIWDFREVDLGDVESVSYVSVRSTFECAVDKVVELSGNGVVLFQKHSYSLIIISFFFINLHFFILITQTNYLTTFCMFNNNIYKL